MKWELNFIEPIKLARRFTHRKYILMATNYATKWVEAKTFQMNTTIMIVKLLYEYILTRFGCPLILVTYQGVDFINDDIKHLIDHLVLKHGNSTTYYPQGNGHAKSTNKFIVNLVTKLINENKIN